MKTVIKFVLALVLTSCAFSAPAGWVSGYFRSDGTYVAPYYRSDYGLSGSGYRSYSESPSSGYVYRNPYAAYPSVSVRGYYRSTGIYVAPHFRTPPNATVTDNLSYRGYGTIRMPKYSTGW